jgi:hypothetical protein
MFLANSTDSRVKSTNKHGKSLLVFRNLRVGQIEGLDDAIRGQDANPECPWFGRARVYLARRLSE